MRGLILIVMILLPPLVGCLLPVLDRVSQGLAGNWG